MSELRVGSGFDAHRLVDGRPLVLGGVRIAHERGLEGHSDGDCLLHALCDALLGAVAAGDMGAHFPSRDQRWKGTDSLLFLEEASRIVASRGYAIENVDATIIAQAPPLASYVEDMRRMIGRSLALELTEVSVKLKSADTLGALGRGEGIAAQATVLLRRA